MYIKDFNTFVEEGMFSGMVRRANSEIKKKEEGKKVMTCLGIEVFLNDPDCDYNGLINDMLATISENAYSCVINYEQDLDLSYDEKANIKEGCVPYDHLLYDGKYGTSIIGSFSTYNEVCEEDEKFAGDFTQHDYIELCKCVATKLKEIGGHLEQTSNKVYLMDGFGSSQYTTEFLLLLVDESTVYNWTLDHDGDGTMFHDDIIDKFPELEDEDFIVWQYNNNGGFNLGIPISVNTVNNFQKYYDYTQKWFKS